MSLIGVAMGINFASKFLQGVANSRQAMERANAYWQQADVYRHNAAITRLNGARQEDVLRRQNRATIARSYAAGGEAGMSESETFAKSLAHTAAALEQNVLDTRYQTESEAVNYLYQANVATVQAAQMKKKSKNLFQSGLINGVYGALTAYNNGID